MFQLHRNHHQAVYVRSIIGNHIPADYIYLQMFSGRYFGLTYKGMGLLHIDKHSQYKYYCIKLNN